MADLMDVITSAVAEANDNVESPDAGGETPEGTETPADETPETSGEEEVVEETSEGKGEAEPIVEGEEPVVEEKEPVVEKKVEKKEKSQLDKDLEELGLKDPKPGEKINKIPQPRVKKMVENFGKKVEARFTAEIGTLKGENTKLTAIAKNVANVDKLIESDPDRYITMLSTIHPGKYDKFLASAKGTGTAPVKEVAKVESKLGPRPQPDVTFEDKTKGYSPERHDELLDWVAAKAKEDAKAEAMAEIETRMEAKYGKVAKAYEAREALNAEIPKVKAQVAAVYETWGQKLVDDNETAIVALMEANPEMSTAEAVARVLVPLTRADRNKMREDLRKETHKRTAAAAKIVPGNKTAGKEDVEEGPKDLTDVIKAQVARIRR